MINNSTSLYRDNFVFCPPPLGKPDPNLPIDLEGRQPRKRILQKGQKEGTCDFYAMALIRLRIGKYPPKSLEEARKTEILISKYRKLLTENDKQDLTPFARLLKDEAKGKVDKKYAEGVILIGKTELYSEMKIEFDGLEEFCKQNESDDFYEYVINRRAEKILMIFRSFFEEIHVNPQRYYEENHSLRKRWCELSMEEKIAIHTNGFFSIARMKYGLKKSSWNPNQPIECLIEQLKAHGPHLVTGKIGKSYYNEEPFKLSQQVAGRSIFGWKLGTERSNLELNAHSIVIVGARRDKNYVYFIDPSDDSDPANVNSQGVYVISYGKLKENMCTLDGTFRKHPITGENVFIGPEDNYALYGNPKENYL